MKSINVNKTPLYFFSLDARADAVAKRDWVDCGRLAPKRARMLPFSHLFLFLFQRLGNLGKWAIWACVASMKLGYQIPSFSFFFGFADSFHKLNLKKQDRTTRSQISRRRSSDRACWRVDGELEENSLKERSRITMSNDNAGRSSGIQTTSNLLLFGSVGIYY